VVLYRRVEIDRVCKALTRLSIDVLLEIVTVITRVDPVRKSGRLGRFGSRRRQFYIVVHTITHIMSPGSKRRGVVGRLPSDHDDPPVRRRVVWTGDTADCTVCGTEFELSDRHYYPLDSNQVDLVRDATSSVLLCSVGCVEAFREDRTEES
jgi:hypothetical protein